MSDAKLPAEGETCLVWQGEYFTLATYTDGVWHRVDRGDPFVIIDGWLSLDHAKAAGRLAEALRAVASGDVPGVSIGPRQREWANEVLREIGT